VTGVLRVTDVPLPVAPVVPEPGDVVPDEEVAGVLDDVVEDVDELDDELLLEAGGLAGGVLAGGVLAGGVLTCVWAGLMGAMCSGFLIGFGSAAATAGRVSASSAVTRIEGVRNRMSAMIRHVGPARKVRCRRHPSG
jgi:hypothetical protein